MEMNGEPGGENGEVKVDAGEAGEPERHAQEVESIHGAISDPTRGCHVQTRNLLRQD
jgi:hypothetical protein